MKPAIVKRGKRGWHFGWGLWLWCQYGAERDIVWSYMIGGVVLTVPSDGGRADRRRAVKQLFDYHQPVFDHPFGDSVLAALRDVSKLMSPSARGLLGHALGNPLSVVAHNLTYLKESIDDADAIEAIDDALTAAKTLEDCVCALRSTQGATAEMMSR
jgi:hypothetical protein